MAPKSRHAFVSPAIITGWLFALLQLAYRGVRHQLGANPIATTLNQLGLLALVLLVATLCCTPLKSMLGWTWPARVRRTLGLLGFFTALLHFSLYLGLDQGFDLLHVASDIGKRRFIAVGFLALLLLVPLAWTSSKRAVMRLTFPVWKRLHRLIYPAAVLACLHFFLRVKADHTQPLVYAGIVLLGFGVRLVAWRAKIRGKSGASRGLAGQRSGP